VIAGVCIVITGKNACRLRQVSHVIACVKYLLIAAARDSMVVHGSGWVEIFQILVGWVGLGPL